MPSHNESRTLPYSADQMFDLVADVGRYPEFLPWCTAARIRSCKPCPEGEEMHADLIIGFQLFRERFGSRVLLDRNARHIQTEYLDGPFRYLKSNWHFKPEEQGCSVAFDVDFEFKNIILQKAAGLFFFEAMQKIVRAFETRADTLYG